MRIALYLIAIVAANYVTATFQPLNIGGFIITWGTWFIGATFILRDLVQQKHGRRVAYMAILGALIISIFLSLWQGDLLPITIASGVSFLISESLDTEIFTRLQTTFSRRVVLSGIIGGLFDSSIFICLGLSPIGAGFLSWELVPLAILGQWVVKSILQLVGAGVVKVVVSE